MISLNFTILKKPNIINNIKQNFKTTDDKAYKFKSFYTSKQSLT